MARTTLVIPDTLWREVKLHAARENRNISEWVTEAIQLKMKPVRKTAPTGLKFDDFWISKPMGLSIEPTRDAIYDLPDDRGRTWR